MIEPDTGSGDTLGSGWQTLRELADEDSHS